MPPDDEHAPEPRTWYKSVIIAVQPQDNGAAVDIQVALTAGWLSIPLAVVRPRVGDPIYWRGPNAYWSRHLVIGECEVWNEYATA